MPNTCLGGACPHDHPERVGPVVIRTTWTQVTVVEDLGAFPETGDLDDLPEAELARVETLDPESIEIIDWQVEKEESP